MVRKRQSREPLFYIQQPQMNKPVAPMQDSYTTPKKTSKEPSKQDEKDSAFRISKRGTNFQQFHSSSTETESETAKEAISDSSRDDKSEEDDDTAEINEASNRQKFKDMTISEKIDYFVHMPSHIPKLKCEIRTDERTYRGTITGREEAEEGDYIVVRTGRRTFNISRETITDIRLLGL